MIRTNKLEDFQFIFEKWLHRKNRRELFQFIGGWARGLQLRNSLEVGRTDLSGTGGQATHVKPADPSYPAFNPDKRRPPT
jgi:hypothetical protein